jgi:hypothetical protein
MSEPFPPGLLEWLLLPALILVFAIGVAKARTWAWWGLAFAMLVCICYYGFIVVSIGRAYVGVPNGREVLAAFRTLGTISLWNLLLSGTTMALLVTGKRELP